MLCLLFGFSWQRDLAIVYASQPVCPTACTCCHGKVHKLFRPQHPKQQKQQQQQQWPHPSFAWKTSQIGKIGKSQLAVIWQNTLRFKERAIICGSCLTKAARNWVTQQPTSSFHITLLFMFLTRYLLEQCCQTSHLEFALWEVASVEIMPVFHLTLIHKSPTANQPAYLQFQRQL